MSSRNSSRIASLGIVASFAAWTVLAHALAWSPNLVSRLSVGLIVAALVLSATNAWAQKPVLAAASTFLWVILLGVTHILTWRFSPGRVAFCSELGARCPDGMYGFVLPALGVIAAVVAAGISALLARLARRWSRSHTAHSKP